MDARKHLTALAVVLGMCLLFPVTRLDAEEKILFDFEDRGDAAHWQPLSSSDLEKEEPAAKVELTTEGATSGKQALKITFAGGKLPGVRTTKITVPEWRPPLYTLEADVTAPRKCLVIFRGIAEKSGVLKRDCGIFVKTALLEKGRNHVEDVLFPMGYGGWATLSKDLGNIVSFEIAMYCPNEGESITVDNIHLSTERPARTTPFRQRNVHYMGERIRNYPWYPKLDRKIKVLGTDWEVTDVKELADRLKQKWVMPENKSVEEAEAEFRARYDALKATHPKAVLAIFRDGQKGVDPADPDKVYAGWKDCYMGGHDPCGIFVKGLGKNLGKSRWIEMFLRRRSPLMQVDLSSIPKGSRILAAQLLLVRSNVPDPEAAKKPGGWQSPYKPTFWVAEPCNRPWEEYELSGLEYARGKFWTEVCGMYWSGDDPDFFPLVIAYGQSTLMAMTWDFTEAVKYWTSGEHENHGFILYTVAGHFDYAMIYSREWDKIKQRPAIMVVYEPKP